MKTVLLLATYLLLSGVPTCKVDSVDSESQPITHEKWDGLLKKYVDDEGWVDYAAWTKDSASVNEYLELLSTHHPNEKNWSRDERLAYWINAYNAFTVKLILDNWPLESIKDIKGGIGFVNSVWDEKFIQIEGQTYDLNNIEHGIIRPKFEDARIHAAVNCASVSCPKLRNEAYTASRLNEQLDNQVTYILSSFRNNLDASPPMVSSIFNWYGGDFKWGDSNLAEFISKYSGKSFPKGQDFKFLDYNWSINSIENRVD